MSFGSRLKQARTAKKMTQKQLGALIGCTGSSIANYEKGTSYPLEDLLIRMMSVLGVDANFLYADDMAAISDTYFLSPEEEQLITTFRSLSSEGQRLMLATAQSFATNPAYQKNTDDQAI